MLDTRRKKKSDKNLEEKESGKKVKKKEAGKNARTQESCLVRHFLSRQTRFCLEEYHKNVQICIFRQESCIEGMAKEYSLITKKIKSLERREARMSTSEVTWELFSSKL